MNTTTTRVDLKVELGLGTVKQITAVRKGLGHPEWQNSSMSDSDADEVRLYFTHIRTGISVEEALEKVAQSRSGDQQDFDSINPEAIDHSQNRDSQEEQNEIVSAIQNFAQEATLAVTDVSAQVAEQVVDSFCIGLSNNVAAQLNAKAGGLRANFRQVATQIRKTPLNLVNGSLEKKPPRQIGGLY